MVASGRSEITLRPKKTILCVDDNEQILSVRTFLLETRGYNVVTASNAQEALDFVRHSLPGALDLLLCDLLMPQMDGNELVRRAKQFGFSDRQLATLLYTTEMEVRAERKRRRSRERRTAPTRCMCTPICCRFRRLC